MTELKFINRQWLEIKSVRNRLLKESDYTQMLDSPLSTESQENLAQYRQALRDLPQLTDNPNDIVWPIKPE
ncbi:tail fiber assembly protein [Shewanella sp. GutDb-MelDb]|uniref:tail fiber assembly protein n=1 Tax=Shewanella sp. GutDb-MelDb TaxID=2058316 RepID=UPI000C79FCC9|nr:tail fiber assembly protein [Shewanella sp. GutDb-MelDb]PKG57746.1 hypothetical protein CXF82_08205 [Shewanella sp. GutDb-MelDb]